MSESKKPAINATYCLHCTRLCKQPATVHVMACPHREYIVTRQPDKVYRMPAANKA